MDKKLGFDRRSSASSLPNRFYQTRGIPVGALARFPGFSEPEGDPLAVECDDPAVRDGDPVGVP